VREGIFIRLLGAVSATRASQPIDLGPASQRAALAVLASAAARPVSMNQIVAGIWGDRAPRNAEQSVYTYIAGLRRAFEPGRGRREPSRLLAGTPAGYVLCLEPAQVDALVFAERVGALENRRMAQLVSATEDAASVEHGQFVFLDADGSDGAGDSSIPEAFA
jgi:DNA-binding SARP family transcriptional activator